MRKLNRRECMQGMLAGVASAAGPSAPLGMAKAGDSQPAGTDKDRMKICLVWRPSNPHLAALSKQIGVTHAIASTAEALARVPRNQYLDTIARMKAEYEAAGFTIAGIESHPVPAEKIKLGLPGRDEEIENYMAAIEALAAVGIRLVCYDFMAGIDWYRTDVSVLGRGGCSTMSFDIRAAQKQGLTQWGRISEDRIWQNIEFFQKAIIPVAEKVGVQMALHPDDPPVPELRGIARILISAANYRRVMNIVPSPVNGITFDHSVFYLMGEDIKTLAREWCREKKIFYLHTRNLRGTRDNFVETFQDDGAIDFGEMFQTYHDNGFRGPLRPDHDPILDGEVGVRPGYGVLGKILGVGYIKGIMASRRIPYA